MADISGGTLWSSTESTCTFRNKWAIYLRLILRISFYKLKENCQSNSSSPDSGDLNDVVSFSPFLLSVCGWSPKCIFRTLTFCLHACTSLWIKAEKRQNLLLGSHTVTRQCHSALCLGINSWASIILQAESQQKLWCLKSTEPCIWGISGSFSIFTIPTIPTDVKNRLKWYSRKLFRVVTA